MGLTLVAKEQSTDDERVGGPNSSGKGAKHWWRNVKGLDLAAKEQSTDDERVEGSSSSGKGAKHWWRA